MTRPHPNAVRQTPTRKRAYLQARKFGLTDDERHDLAEIVLKVDCRSWNDLSDDQIETLVHGMAVTEYLCELARQKGRQSPL